jgi:hypothetical protein
MINRKRLRRNSSASLQTTLVAEAHLAEEQLLLEEQMFNKEQ